MPSPFQGPQLKIERAKCHITELQKEMGIFIKDHPYSLVLQRDTQRGKQGIVPVGGGRIPDKFSLIVGDAIHNLRANPRMGSISPLRRTPKDLKPKSKEK
jgi:hypothetical protein